jgi:hypothetical protein
MWITIAGIAGGVAVVYVLSVMLVYITFLMGGILEKWQPELFTPIERTIMLGLAPLTIAVCSICWILSGMRSGDWLYGILARRYERQHPAPVRHSHCF